MKSNVNFDKVKSLSILGFRPTTLELDYTRIMQVLFNSKQCVHSWATSEEENKNRETTTKTLAIRKCADPHEIPDDTGLILCKSIHKLTHNTV